MTPASAISPVTTLRNTQAKYLYAILEIFGGIPAVLAVFSPQGWQVLGCMVLAHLFMLRYLMPVRASIGEGSVDIRWPLRRVTITPDKLVKAAPTPTFASPVTMALRVRGAGPFNLVVEQFADAPELARALIAIVEASPHLSPAARHAATRALARHATAAGADERETGGAQ